MSWIHLLLGATVIVRGLGAGIIFDSAVVSPPLRHRIGVIPYARYLRANLSGFGTKSYVTVAWAGALLTIASTVATVASHQPAATTWWTVASLAATVLAFMGTGLALPALFRVKNAPDLEEQLVPLLDRYARWYGFSALWQAVAFIASALALASQ